MLHITASVCRILEKHGETTTDAQLLIRIQLRRAVIVLPGTFKQSGRHGSRLIGLTDEGKETNRPGWAKSRDYYEGNSRHVRRTSTARRDRCKHDIGDIVFLVRYLKLKTPDDVMKIVAAYYPEDKIPVKAQYLIEGLFEEGKI